jgi:DNA-binding MltR family transcriptional regulator
MLAILRHFLDRAISGFALSICAKLDAALEAAILEKMRPISQRLRITLFEGYGPLASFSAKIDIAFALSIIDEAMYADLKVIKEIRNQFAHPPISGGFFQPVTFESEAIKKSCSKFKGFGPTITGVDLFGIRAINACSPVVSTHIVEVLPR